VRAYIQQGHGPRAETQTGYISAISAATPKSSCEQQSAHTFRPFPLDISLKRSVSRVAPTPVRLRVARMTGLCVVGAGRSGSATMWRS
jgi:hypothetical protein